jgi:copper(I)-binding protein
MMKRMKLIMATLLLGSWFGLAQAAEHMMADNAWIREAPPGAKALAGYLTLMNHADKPRVLVGASSPAFGMVMLHRTVMEEGMAKMVHQEAITIPAEGSVIFEPNDYHLMLIKPKQALKAGDLVDITLEFKNGQSMVVTHEVRAGMGGMDHGGMDHGSMHH